MITQQRLKELFVYEQTTGVFIRKEREDDKWFNSRFANKTAGTIGNHGYATINIDHKIYLAHRLAWLYVHGAWPQDTIDHKDRNPLNNAIDNLLDVPQVLNNENKKQRRGLSNHKGIQKHREKWSASIDYRGKRLWFGVFDTIEEASVAYENGIKNIEKIYEEKSHLVKRKYWTNKSNISHSELISCLYYDKDTGKFYRKPDDIETKGYITAGYRRIQIKNKRYPAHVLAFFYMTEALPTKIIDHINGDKTDNRWCNLREVNHSMNGLNKKCKPSRGIRRTRNKITRWEAAITIEGIRHQIGTFDTETDAKTAWNDFIDAKELNDFVERKK